MGRSRRYRLTAFIVLFTCLSILFIAYANPARNALISTSIQNKPATNSPIQNGDAYAGALNAISLPVARHNSTLTPTNTPSHPTGLATATATTGSSTQLPTNSTATATTSPGPGGGIPTHTPPPINPGPPPTTALPNYFSFGVMSAPGEASVLASQRQQNGTAYAFRYTYLTGGVNTGQGWENWNSPPGQYATIYMQESTQYSYIPVFVYYEICLSNGPQPGTYCGGHNIQQDTGNLNDPSTMKAYYANWVLMLQKIGAFGKPVLVIVEPDLWGFLENAANGSNNAATIPASVSSSGYADAAGFPNNAQGFSWALLHMRDHYAPNALLALHASTWAAGIDIATDTSQSLDVNAIVQQESTFLNSAGLVGNPSNVSTWNLLSNDVADFDSAQPGGRSWWDRYNNTYPNFSRYLQYVNGLHAATHQRIIMWQVPMGNQYFDTMNDSPGHYQDNRAEYILSHVQNFAQAGIIGVLFGPGNGGTYNLDATGDGVTNPPAINTYECNQCNNHTSSYSDDDGGYLRIFVGQYMRNPLPLP